MNTNELLTVSNEAVIFITQLTDLSTSLKLLLTRYFYFLLSYPQPVENFYTHWGKLFTYCGKNSFLFP